MKNFITMTACILSLLLICFCMYPAFAEVSSAKSHVGFAPTAAAPDEATPDEATPDEATLDEATPDEATPDEETVIEEYSDAIEITLIAADSSGRISRLFVGESRMERALRWVTDSGGSADGLRLTGTKTVLYEILYSDLDDDPDEFFDDEEYLDNDEDFDDIEDLDDPATPDEENVDEDDDDTENEIATSDEESPDDTDEEDDDDGEIYAGSVIYRYLNVDCYEVTVDHPDVKVLPGGITIKDMIPKTISSKPYDGDPKISDTDAAAQVTSESSPVKADPTPAKASDRPPQKSSVVATGNSRSSIPAICILPAALSAVIILRRRKTH